MVVDEGVINIIIAVLGVIGGGAFWGYMTSRKEVPIKKRDSDIAGAAAAQHIMSEVTKELRTELSRVKEDLQDEVDKSEGMETRIVALEATMNEQTETIHSLRSALRAWREWARSVVLHWDVMRQTDAPPPFPPMDPEDE